MNLKENKTPTVFTLNQNYNFDFWRVESIKNTDGTDKMTENYSALIGCTVAILYFAIGQPLCWSYVADSNGGVKAGVFKSEKLDYLYYNYETETLCANLPNCHYVLKKLPKKWGEIYADRYISVPHWYSDCVRVAPLDVPCGKGEQHE